MKDIRVRKDDLISVLKKNRGQHCKIFLEAQDGYRAEVITQLDKLLEEAREGRNITSYIEFQEPMDQTKDYDRAILMLEMTTEDEVAVSEADFRSYVMDDWSWKGQFLTSNSPYSATALAMLAV